MTDITPTAELARENARTSSGQFGTQAHTAPEVTLAATDPKTAIVDEIIGSYFDGQSTRNIDVSEIRQLMLDAISQHQEKNPAIVVIDGEGKANDVANVEVIDLDYLGEWYDDGNSAAFHVERATEDLERIRAAGLESESPSYQLREYLGNELDADWWDSDDDVIEGVYGDRVVVSPLIGATEFDVRDVHTGDILSTHSDFAEAKAAAQSAGENQ